MATFNVTIVYTPVENTDVKPLAYQIMPTFDLKGSYVDTAPYNTDGGVVGAREIWSTNVWDNGVFPTFDGLNPYGDATYPMAWLKQAVIAYETSVETEGENAGVTFEVAGADEQLYWTVLGQAFASQGFAITVETAEESDGGEG